MPPYANPRTIWHNVRREVTITTDTTTKPTHSVLVTFTRMGYSNETQQPVEEVLAIDIIASKLSTNAAEDMKRTIQMVCDHTYSPGYSAARNGHTI